MDTFSLVRPEHLNHHGYLFGGMLLKWADEFAWLVASRDFPGCTLVTIGMDEVAFRHRVTNGSILRFSTTPLRQGRTSITYGIEVYADAPGSREEAHVFSNRVTFVHIDAAGDKIPLPKVERYRSQG